MVTVNEVFRDWTVDGVPSSGVYDPTKAQIRELLLRVESSAISGLVTAATLAALTAVASADGTGGIVLADPVAVNNGFYVRESGAWVWRRGLSDTVSKLASVGGTANAITADAAVGVDMMRVQMVILTATLTNTGAATLSVGGATALPILGGDGLPVVAGSIVSGGTYLLVVGTSDYRMIVDSRYYTISDTIFAASDTAVAAKNEAVAARDEVAGLWLGLQATDPTGTITAGARYFNTVLLRTKTYSGGVWVAEAPGILAYSASDPSPTNGANGDLWLNSSSMTLFGPKAAGAWPTGVSLVGQTGGIGPTGPAGSDGPGVYFNRSNFAEVTEDSSGNFGYGLKRDGHFVVQELEIGTEGDTAQRERPSLTRLGMMVADIDQSGNVAFGVSRDVGPIWPFTEMEIAPRAPSYDTSTGIAYQFEANAIRMFIVVGQSLATQENAGSESTLTTTAVDPGYALMFDVGAWPNARNFGGFADLHEQPYGSSRETICSGFAKAYNTKLNTLFGQKQKILLAVCGKTSLGYSSLKRGTQYWSEAQRLIRAARDYAHIQGLRLIVDSVLVLHGETDAATANRVTYRRYLDQWHTDFSHFVRETNPQATPVRMYTYQTAATTQTAGAEPQVSLAQYDTSDARPLLRCIGPIYDIPRVDGVHQTVIGSFRMGEKFADAILRDQGGLPEAPIRVVSAMHSSATAIDVKFNQPVTIDTTNAIVDASGLGVGLGFDFWSAGATTPAISSVAMVSGQTDTVRVTLASAPAGPNKRLFLACKATGASAGPTLGGRSAIRASTSFATSQQDGATALYHWAPSIVMEIA